MTENNLPPKGETKGNQEPQVTAPKNVTLNTQEIKSLEPARFPVGFWKRVDYLLRHPDEIMESLRSDNELWNLSRIFFIVSLLMAAIYGAVMGATNLLQNSNMLLSDKFLMILITAIKVPILFLLTLVIIFPPIYVSNAFVGAQLSFRQMITMLLASLAIIATILASMATVAFFFALTSKSYHFIKLLHVLFFAYAGLSGASYLSKCVSSMSLVTIRQISPKVFLVWLLLYIFVGTQLAWVLRPFVGSPNEKFQVFRPRSGNFYESVASSLVKVMKKEEDKK